jgi:hypothetical protein
VIEGRPKVPLVINPSSFASRGERLAGAGASPDGSIIRPTSLSQCMAPNSNAGEEVALGKFFEIVGSDVFDASFINNSRGYMPSYY